MSDKFNHVFFQGKYLLLAGDQTISKMDTGKLTEIINSNNNKMGKNVKVLIGTSKMREGIDLHKIRQINIMEPWYNLSRIEQVIGRGVRFKSHCGLPENNRNVEIFLLSSHNKYSENETIDEAYYRLSENKDVEIKKIERILKVKAVDCVLNKVDNVIKKPIISKQVTSMGEQITVKFGDIPYSRQCDYLKNCDYKCCWEPDKNKKYKIDSSTYNLFFAQDDINNSINIVKDLYRNNIIFTINEIVSYVNSNDNNIDNLYINIALNNMVKNKDILYDKFDREGYLIYKGNYYIFQPLEIKDESIPMYYRSIPLKMKPDKFTIIDKIDTHVSSNKKKNQDININVELQKIKKHFPEFSDKILLQFVMSKIDTNLFFKLMKHSLCNIMNKKIDAMNKLIIESQLKNIFLFRNKFVINPSYSDIKNNKNCFVGVFLGKKYIYLSNDKWVELEKHNIHQLYKSIKNKKKKENNEIYGYVENKQFKIVNKTKYKESMTVNYKESKRSMITGRTCSTFEISNLLTLLKYLGYKQSKYKSKKDLCHYIQLILRKNQEENKNNRIWFT